MEIRFCQRRAILEYDAVPDFGKGETRCGRESEDDGVLDQGPVR